MIRRTRQLVCALVVLTAAPLAAVTVPERGADVAEKLLRRPELNVTALTQRADRLAAGTIPPGLAGLGVAPEQAFLDRRTGRWETLMLARPLIPGNGRGNRLSWDGLKHTPPSSAHDLERALWDAFVGFLDEHRAALTIDVAELSGDDRPRPGRVTVLDDGKLVRIHAPRTVDGVPVRSSYASAVVNRGNLVLFGAQNWADVSTSSRPTIDEATARAAVAGHLAPLAAASWDRASLAFVPVVRGQGLDHRLAWVLRLGLAGDPGPWEALVDAHGGELLAFEDTRHYAATPRTVIGGVHPVSNDGLVPDGIEQPGWPMPFADLATAACGNGVCEAGNGEDCLTCAADCNGVQGGKPSRRFCCGAGGGENPVDCSDTRCTSGGFQCSNSPTTLFTDAGGNLAACVDGTVTTALDGRFVTINDACGAISESTTGSVLDLGTSPGTDCNVAPGASPGNTRAARTTFYELNRIKAMARGQLPGNPWLQAQLPALTNTQLTCGGFWNGTAVSVSRSGSPCSNLGEIAGVVDHEWGHGMDQNDANGFISNPSEGIADVYAALRLDLSCIGRGALPGLTCSGYGDPCKTCSGVRDLDWMNRASMQPHDVAWADAFCGSGNSSPCGGTVHCEGALYAEAVWDLYNRDVPCLGSGWENVGGGRCVGAAAPSFDKNAALEIATRLTYLGAGGVGVWFQCAVPFGGCSATGGYLSFLAADDDNGNLGDGTPHMSAIFAAFDRHGIACDTPVVSDSGCAGGPVTAPSVTATPLDRGVLLSWNAVSGAVQYRVFRTDGVHACDFGKELVGETTALELTDSGLLNGREYYYVVIPATAEDTCMGPASDCTAVIPIAGASDCPFCGNDVIEGSEVCDGANLGGESCTSQGCTGGTLACLSDCSGFDLSGCTGCGATCGDGVCDSSAENCLTCPQDCNGQQSGKPANRFCCGDGGGENPVPCSDPRCTEGGLVCI